MSQIYEIDCEIKVILQTQADCYQSYTFCLIRITCSRIPSLVGTQVINCLHQFIISSSFWEYLLMWHLSYFWNHNWIILRPIKISKFRHCLCVTIWWAFPVMMHRQYYHNIYLNISFRFWRAREVFTIVRDNYISTPYAYKGF